MKWFLCRITSTQENLKMRIQQQDWSKSLNKDFYKDRLFDTQWSLEDNILKHPLFCKIEDQDAGKVVLRLVNLTTKEEAILINQTPVSKILVSLYLSEGKIQKQYMPKAQCEIRLSSEEFHTQVEDVTRDEWHINRLGGDLNILKIKEILENWETPPVYSYNDFLKLQTLKYYNKWVEKNKEFLDE